MRLIHFYAITALLLLISCQKPVDEELPEAPEVPVETGDSTLVHQYLEMAMDAPPGEDTGTVYTWNYDEQKRPTVYEERWVADPPWNYRIVIKYFYANQADKWPYLATRRVYVPAGQDRETYDSMFLFYQGEFVSMDSVRGYDSETNAFLYYSVTEVRVSGVDVTVYNRGNNGSDPGTPETEHHLKVYRENGNFTKQLGSLYSDPPFVYYTYNDHPDPLRRCYLPFVFPYENWEWGPEAYTNLMTERRRGETVDANSYIWKMSYTYRADGYPLTSIWQDNTWPEPSRQIYIYY